jgi:uncharacterized protein (DUF1501 family)
MATTLIATRRELLARGLGIVGTTAVLPQFMLRTALAGTKDNSADQRIVIALLLTGGPDGLSLVPPTAHADYYRYRKSLAVDARQAIRLNDEVGLHPRLTGMKKLLDEGQMAVVLGTGYPNFDLSHFVSRDYWEAADARNVSGKPGSTGWLGRYLDYACKGQADPTLNVAVGPGRQPLILTGKDHPGVGFSSADAFRFRGARSVQAEALYRRLNESSGAPRAEELQFVAQTAVHANQASERIGRLAAEYSTPVAYPDTQFGNSVRTIAGLINGGLGARVYYAAQGIAVFGGYDTHADQVRRLDTLLGELDQSVSALYQDLARCGNAGRVLTFTFSEFGRRVQENFSGGTDHGLAQPMFLFGPGVKGGVHGKQPSLADLDERGNLKMQVDFRSVYAAVLERWLGVPSEAILSVKYPPVDCVRT